MLSMVITRPDTWHPRALLPSRVNPWSHLWMNRDHEDCNNTLLVFCPCLCVWMEILLQRNSQSRSRTSVLSRVSVRCNLTPGEAALSSVPISASLPGVEPRLLICSVWVFLRHCFLSLSLLSLVRSSSTSLLHLSCLLSLSLSLHSYI